MNKEQEIKDLELVKDWLWEKYDIINEDCKPFLKSWVWKTYGNLCDDIAWEKRDENERRVGVIIKPWLEKHNLIDVVRSFKKAIKIGDKFPQYIFEFSTSHDVRIHVDYNKNVWHVVGDGYDCPLNGRHVLDHDFGLWLPAKRVVDVILCNDLDELPNLLKDIELL